VGQLAITATTPRGLGQRSHAEDCAIRNGLGVIIAVLSAIPVLAFIYVGGAPSLLALARSRPITPGD
jgi:hypothetical protein